MIWVKILIRIAPFGPTIDTFKYLEDSRSIRNALINVYKKSMISLLLTYDIINNMRSLISITSQLL
jgi:hypothetical protein